MPNRRAFLKISALAAGSALLPWKWTGIAYAQLPGGTLPPEDIGKYVMPLVIPPVMPPTARTSRFDFYKIGVRQFQQQILPANLPKTTVWSYGSLGRPGTFNYPSFTIEATYNREVRVRWVNELVDRMGRFLPHLLPVDPTLHWANPPGGAAGRDMRPTFTETPGSYTGPVPIVTHLHGGRSTQENDGYPEAWFLPHAVNVPAGYATHGTFFDMFKQLSPLGEQWAPGQAVFQYLNEQRASTLWYHDHALGITRLNVYAGLAGFYLIRGGPDDLVLDKRSNTTAVLPGPPPGVGSNPFGTFYEIPIVIQDRSFNADGSLFYPHNRAFFEGLEEPPTPPSLDIPFIGATACDGQASDISPIWNPEFFGNTIVVNGRTWPFLEVEQRRYRFRFLNGCNSRFLVLKFDHPNVDVWQIGTEGGFLPTPVRINDLNVGGLGGVLLMGLAERADVIVDFTNVPRGSSVMLLNLAPDEPFGGFPIDAPSDPSTTGQVMVFRVVAATSPDTSTPPDRLVLPTITGLGTPDNTRQVSLNEASSQTVKVSTDASGGIALDCAQGELFGPREALLGIMDSGNPVEKMWGDSITENPALGDTEVWEIYNFTEDAHPIHIHEIFFQIVDRELIEGGTTRPPEAWETGLKDTVIAYPGEITRLKANFDRPGLFVWHCHILEHEDNEMMRPYFVGP